MIVDAKNSTFRSTLFDGAVEGHVLVKNMRSALPLSSPVLSSVFGYHLDVTALIFAHLPGEALVKALVSLL